MAGPVPIGMDKADLKKLLVASKREPVNCAIGVGKEQQGMILLHKIKPARSLLQELQKETGGALKTPGFGTAFVDIDDNPKLVVLTVNKAAGGIARRLRRSLKGTGFSKVIIKLEDGTIADADEGEEEGEGEGEAVAASNDASAPSPPRGPVPPNAPPPDAGALSADLAAMVRLIPGGPGTDPDLKARLVKLAKDANVYLKTNNLSGATPLLAEMRGALETAGVSIAPITPTQKPPSANPLAAELGALMRRIPEAAPAGPAVKAQLVKLAGNANASLKAGDAKAADLVAQLRAALRDALDGAGVGIGAVTPDIATPLPALRVWMEAKEAVDQQLGALYDLLRRSGLKPLGEIADEIESVLESFRVGLAASLTSYDRETGAKKEAARATALTAVAQYQARLDTDKFVAGADNNPFGVKVTARSTLQAALERLSAQLASA